MHNKLSTDSSKTELEKNQEKQGAGEGLAPPQIQIRRADPGPVQEHRALPFALASGTPSKPEPARRADEHPRAQCEVARERPVRLLVMLVLPVA